MTPNIALLMSVAGEQLTTTAILIAGLADLLAGSCAMAIGGWVSVDSVVREEMGLDPAELGGSDG